MTASAMSDPSGKRSYGRTAALISLVVVVVLLLSVGTVWFINSLPAPLEPEVQTPSSPPDFTPAFATLPWKRSPDTLAPVVVARPALPWRRSSRHPEAVWVPPAAVPWVRSSVSPSPVTIRTATLPWP